MKTILLLFINSIFGLAGIGQDSTISLSKFETFSSQPLKILKIETKEIGSVGSWMVTKLKTTDAATGINVSAVKIDQKFFNNVPEIVNPTTLYIDIEGLDSVINALDYFIKEQNIQKPEGYLEYSYFTSADVKVSCYYAGNWRFEISKVYQKLRSPVAGSVITFNKKRITELVELLRQSEIAK
ncbi:MAG: hypothetical protein ABJA90_07660, partial [Ginsengibacter sp.]